MKKSWIIRALLFLVSCIPFSFLCVYGDVNSGTMLFYGLMIVGFAVLCWGALKTNNAAMLYIGNALSFASSCAAAKLSGLEPMGHYFKPFTSCSLIVTISVVAVMTQTAVVLYVWMRKKQCKNGKKPR